MSWFKRKVIEVEETKFVPELLDFEPDPNNQPHHHEVELFHRGGVVWWDAPIPPVKHDCWAQTRGYTGYVYCVERCACGAICTPRSYIQPPVWDNKNSRTPK